MNPVRDPNLVFVGMPLSGTRHPKTQELWDLFAEGKTLGRFSFIRRDVASYSAAKGRNIITAMAYTTAASKLLMLDSDMNAGPDQVLRILDNDHPVIAALYPRKELTLVQKWVVETLQPPGADHLADTRHVGAGFMKIEIQPVIGRMIAKYPELRFLCDDDQMRGETMFNLWGEMIATENWTGNGAWPRWLSDDFAFCWRARNVGIKILTDFHCQVGHIGPIDFLQVVSVLQKLMDLPADLEATRSGAPREAGPALPRHT